MGDNFRFVLTVGESLNQIKKFDDNGVLVDVSADKGDGYFPTMTILGKGDLLAYERDYIHDIRNSNFDIKDVVAVLVDTSGSEVFKREFMPMTENLKPDLPSYSVLISKLKKMLESFPPNTVILKKFGEKYISPSYLGNYNNESFPLVSKKGKPITAGLKNNQTATFAFIGKSGDIVGPLKFDFEVKNSKK